MCIIEVKDLTKTFNVKTKQPGLRGGLSSILKPVYKQVEAVKGINFTVKQGEVLAFMGPNGAGKSTTIKMMTGILQPTGGAVRVLDYDPTQQRQALAYRIGTVFGQKSQLWFHLPPTDSFNLLGHIYDLDGATLRKRISELVEIFEIKDLMDVPVRKLSLGQRIRCEIAASILHKPEIIFLDEPTIGLDVVVKQRIRDLILRLNQTEKTTIFLTSHDAGDIEQLCKRAIIINHGEIVIDDSLKRIKYDYLNRKVVSIKYDTPITTLPEDLNILKQKGSALSVEVDTQIQSIDDVLTRLVRMGKVMDITIKEAPLEEIISHIYQQPKSLEPQVM